MNRHFSREGMEMAKKSTKQGLALLTIQGTLNLHNSSSVPSPWLVYKVHLGPLLPSPSHDLMEYMEFSALNKVCSWSQIPEWQLLPPLVCISSSAITHTTSPRQVPHCCLCSRHVACVSSAPAMTMLLTRADVQADEDVTTRLVDRDRGRDVTLSDGPFPRSPQWASLSVCLPGRRAALTLANSWKCQPLPGFVGLNCCFLVATPWSELDATALTFPGPSHLRHPESKLI